MTCVERASERLGAIVRRSEEQALVALVA